MAKFEDQVKDAKSKQLQFRITRDLIFLVLGFTFLIISAFIAYIDKENIENKKTTKVTTTTIQKKD